MTTWVIYTNLGANTVEAEFQNFEIWRLRRRNTERIAPPFPPNYNGQEPQRTEETTFFSLSQQEEPETLHTSCAVVPVSISGRAKRKNGHF